jgi:WD40 repeat protein
MTRASTAIVALSRRNPDALRLAQAVSFAVVVDRALLRAARIAFVPGADAGAEADLWFSSVVTSRTVDGIVFDREVAEELRNSMSAGEIERAWKLIEKEHDWLAPSLRIEEEIAYLSVSKEPDARENLTRRLQAVVRAMLRGDRPGLAQWASRALTMFPSSVCALEETQMLDAGARIRLGQGVAPNENAMPSWMPLVAPSSLPRSELHVELRERELVLFAPEKSQSVVPAMKKILVPDTKPIVLDVSWSAEGTPQGRQVVLRSGEIVRLDVGSDQVLIRTIAGDAFQIGETEAQPPELASEVIDFSPLLTRNAHVVGRERELSELIAARGIVIIIGAVGVGKTALLCELIRRLAPATRVFGHVFRSGDYRMGSISAAMRSIAAQIALAYRLDASVVGLPLGDVVQRLALSPRCPSRLAIVLDAVDDARNEDRDVPVDPLAALFGAVLPSFVTVYATARRRFAPAELVALDLEPSEDAVAEVHGSGIARNSGGNFANAEALVALRAYERNALSQLEKTFGRRSGSDFEHLHALAVARWPLPAAIFGNLESDEPLLYRDGDRIALRNEPVKKRVLGESPEAEHAAHRELLDLLEQNRSLEDVRRYYALHAIEHLLSAGDFIGARRLCLDVTFIGEVVRLYEPELMLAHVRRLLPNAPPEDLLNDVRIALERERDAIAESPDDVEAILRAYLPESALPESTAPLVARVDPHPTDWYPPRRHDAPVAGIIETANGPVSWAADGRVMFWTTRAGAPPIVVEHETAVTCFAEGSGWFVFGDEAGFLHAVDGNSKVFASIAAHPDRVSGVASVVGTSLVATWSAEGVIRLWSVGVWSPGRPPGPIEAFGELLGHEEAIVACHFVGGSRLVSASLDGTTRIWSVVDRRAIRVIRSDAPVHALVVSSDGRWLATGDAAGNLRIAQIDEGSRYLADAAIATQHANGIAGIAIAANDYLAAAWGAEGDGVSIWRMPVGSQWQPPSQVTFIPAPPGASVATCAIMRRGQDALIAWTNGMSVLVDLEGFERRPIDTGGSVIRSIADLPQTFFTGDERGRLLEWNWPGGTDPLDYSKHVGRVEAIAAGPMVLVSDGEKEVYFHSTERLRLNRPRITSNHDMGVVWSSSETSVVRADLSSGELLEKPLPEDYSSRITACAISDEADVAMGKRDGTIRSGLFEDGGEIGIMGSEIVALTFVRNGELLLGAARNGVLAAWHVREARALESTPTEAPIAAIEADAGGKRIATMGADGVISLRTIDNLQVVKKIGTRLDTSLGCRFGSLDTNLVAAGLDHTIRIFDASSGAELIGRGHRAPITGLLVKGDTVFSCSEDHTVRMWDVHTAEPLAVAYGPNAFRCIAIRGDDILVGNDGGEVLTFTRTADIGMWPILADPVNFELAQKLAADLQRRGIRTSVRQSGAYERPGDMIPDSLRQLIRGAAGAMMVMSASALKNDALFEEVAAFNRARKPILVAVVDDTDAFESQRSFAFLNRVDLREWRDPYRYADNLSTLLEHMKRGEPVSA